MDRVFLRAVLLRFTRPELVSWCVGWPTDGEADERNRADDDPDQRGQRPGHHEHEEVHWPLLAGEAGAPHGGLELGAVAAGRLIGHQRPRRITRPTGSISKPMKPVG